MRETCRSLISRAYHAVRSLLECEACPARKYRLKWVVVEGGAQAGLDLADRGALTDLMDERSDNAGRNQIVVPVRGWPYHRREPLLEATPRCSSSPPPPRSGTNG